VGQWGEATNDFAAYVCFDCSTCNRHKVNAAVRLQEIEHQQTVKP
jgi:hypothetical protein